MKIAFFTDTYHPQVNGVVTSIDSFADELRKLGHSVVIFAPSSPDFKEINEFVVTMKSLGFRPYPGYRVAIPTELVGYNFSDFDIIHVHTPATMGVVGTIIARKNKKPLVMTYHTHLLEYSHYLSERFPLVTKKMLKSYVKLFFNKASVVISPSDEIKKELHRMGIKRPIDVVPTGVDFKKIRSSKPSLRKKYKLPLKDRIILHVGRVTKEKNIEAILEAMKLLDNEKIMLVITSDGPYKKDMEARVASMALSGKVVFTGFLSKEALQEYYKLSDVFVMASRTETQGIVLVEAVAHELPVVVMEAPVIADFVRKNHVGLVASDVSDMARKIKSIKSEIFSKHQKKVVKENSKDACAHKLLKVYDVAKQQRASKLRSATHESLLSSNPC
ncbi:MAG: glycosyltransferase [Candidatus Aenigmatarchaeota archaeon]